MDTDGRKDGDNTISLRLWRGINILGNYLNKANFSIFPNAELITKHSKHMSITSLRLQMQNKIYLELQLIVK